MITFSAFTGAGVAMGLGAMGAAIGEEYCHFQKSRHFR